MIWNGFLFSVGLILSSIVIMIVFSLLGVVFSTLFESIVEKKFFKELNKYNWKNRNKKE